MDSSRTPLGLRWTPQGLRLDSVWTPLGVLLECRRTPPGLRPNLWLSIKSSFFVSRSHSLLRRRHHAGLRVRAQGTGSRGRGVAWKNGEGRKRGNPQRRHLINENDRGPRRGARKYKHIVATHDMGIDPHHFSRQIQP